MCPETIEVCFIGNHEMYLTMLYGGALIGLIVGILVGIVIYVLMKRM